jgi:hypothetical protein
MLLIGGVFNVIGGLVAITNASYYASIAATHNVQLPITNAIHTWGWVAFISGIVLVISSFGVFTGAMWARILAAAVVSLNMVYQFGFMAAFPFWSITVLFVDGLVLYAVIVHGGRQD